MELISRKRLIDELVKIAKTSESDWRGIKFSAREIKFLIELQKTIESRPKGKWIERKCREGYSESGTCSECGKKISNNFYFNKNDYNYCPNCGADMRGEE